MAELYGGGRRGDGTGPERRPRGELTPAGRGSSSRGDKGGESGDALSGTPVFEVRLSPFGAAWPPSRATKSQSLPCYCALQMKFVASSVLPNPLYAATWG